MTDLSNRNALICDMRRIAKAPLREIAETFGVSVWTVQHVLRQAEVSRVMPECGVRKPVDESRLRVRKFCLGCLTGPLVLDKAHFLCVECRKKS